MFNRSAQNIFGDFWHLSCSEKNDSAGFEVNSSKGKEEAEAPWKGTLNIVRPQPMYAIPYGKFHFKSI